MIHDLRSAVFTAVALLTLSTMPAQAVEVRLTFEGFACNDSLGGRGVGPTNTTCSFSGQSLGSDYGTTNELTVRYGNIPQAGNVQGQFVIGGPQVFSLGEGGNESLATPSEIFFTPAPGYEVRLVSFARRRGTATANPAYYQLLSPSGAIVYSLRPINEVSLVVESVNSAYYSGPITFQYGTLSSGFTAVDDIVLDVRRLPGTHFVPITPCRSIDTRNTSAIPGGTSRDFTFEACNIPATATAVALNVTLVPNGSLGFLSIWPGNQPQPVVSTMNSLDGRVKANASIVGLGFNRAVSIFVTDTAHVILDVNGYFAPVGTPGALAFYPVTPCRVVDTRNTGGIIPAQGTRRIDGGGSCLPVQAQAYSLNVTVVPPGPLGFLTLFPEGTARPLASTLNAVTGTVVANAAILRAGTAGSFNAYVTEQSHAIVDLNGYFGPPGQPGALAFYPQQPCRVFDTRNTAGAFGGPLLARDATRNFTVPSSACNVPTSAQAYVMNATMVPAGVFGFLTLFPTGVNRPEVSTLNAIDGALTSNAAILPAGAGGTISVYTSDASHMLLDISGYFAP
jgi:hypothetical protein